LNFAFSRLREKVPDRADEGVGSARGSSSREVMKLQDFPYLIVAERLREHLIRPSATFSRRREKGNSGKALAGANAAQEHEPSRFFGFSAPA